MKRKINSNSGFTLIELIIALAMLAFVMISVSSFLSSGMLSFRKAKADISVHNSAQDTYNQIVDSAIQANDIVICGYIAEDPDSEVDFSVSGESLNIELEDTLYFFLRDAEQKASLEQVWGSPIDASQVKYYSDISEDTEIYVKTIITQVSVPFDPANATGSGNRYLNSLTNENVTIKQATREVTDASGNITTENVTSATGQVVYDTNDTLVNIYSFDGDTMYYEKKYAFMTALNDCRSSFANDLTGDYTYNEALSYVVSQDATGITTGNVTGCVANIDVKNGAISFDLYFNSKSMTYTSEGMVKFRNSNVLKTKN